AYVNGNIKDCDFNNIECYGEGNFYILFGNYDEVQNFLENNNEKVKNYRIENDRRNSAIPMLDIKNIDARIEPGAIIRDMVSIGKNA
ncbi:MAG TPA: 2,3,4,5-tetrahydropyridine-2,6-dicarboxylate N-acetyltransferase, partial [Clostridium sp.]|nr:2,3,4,5-tetrahydropyridine-2,6-dicarboxylate N-acetyltransferase [Clostridium sp.]